MVCFLDGRCRTAEQAATAAAARATATDNELAALRQSLDAPPASRPADSQQELSGSATTAVMTEVAAQCLLIVSVFKNL
jgi:hypothetical protein